MKRKTLLLPIHVELSPCFAQILVTYPMGSVALSLLRFLLEFSEDGMCSFLCDLKKMWAVHSVQSSYTGVMSEAILECWGLYSYVR